MNEQLVQIIISIVPAIITALLSGYFTYKSANKKMKEEIKKVKIDTDARLEEFRLKTKNERVEYRYQHLHTYLEQINCSPSIIYKISSEDELMETVEMSNKRWEKIDGIKNLSISLLDDSYKFSIDNSFSEVIKISNALVEDIYTNGGKNNNISPLLNARITAEEALTLSIQNQLRELLGS